MFTSTRSRTYRTFGLALSIGIVAACGDDTIDSDVGTTDATSTTTEAAATATGSGSTGGDAKLPAACAGLTSPFLAADCLVALRDACHALPSQAACAAQAPLLFSDGAYTILCSWSKVVRFADIPACGIESVIGRCEAGLEDATLDCTDRCIGDSLQTSLIVGEDGQELIEMGCTTRDNYYLDGPLGPRATVGADTGPYSSSCAPNLNRPNPPICDCDTLACAAE